MEQFYHLAHAFMHQDLATLSDPKMVFMVYVVLLTFLVLENGFIPTAFLPGDTLLILTGVLIYQGVLPMAVVPLLIRRPSSVPGLATCRGVSSATPGCITG